MNFFDTAVLVAAAIPDHPHHAQCSARLAQLRKVGASCAAHTLAETYNTLTRTSKGYGFPPFAAMMVIAQAGEDFNLVTLSAEETLRTLHSAAESNLSGPIVYDALLVACARKIDARRIYTNNLKHFRQVAPDLASRIVAP